MIYSLGGAAGTEPLAGVVRDTAGNLYGTTCYGGTNNDGTVFELTPSDDGQWTVTTLHTFSEEDGGCPRGDLVLDASGNIYGTTWQGGTHSIGVIFEITP